MSHQFKYDSSTLICKFDYPETRCREEERVKESTGSCKSPQKKVGSRKIILQMKKQVRQEREEKTIKEEKKKKARFQKEKYSKQY